MHQSYPCIRSVVTARRFGLLHTSSGSFSSCAVCYQSHLGPTLTGPALLQVPKLDLSKAQRAEIPWTPGMAGHGDNLTDDDDIWQSLNQAGAVVAAKPVCNAFELAIEVGAFLF